MFYKMLPCMMDRKSEQYGFGSFHGSIIFGVDEFYHSLAPFFYGDMKKGQ
ncbi:hypothetical protein NE261_00050 [Enterococcus italicus]|jgi:hypothetical protein|uniref:Uncharacterized protein n=1 Tax=Enterococcus italicus (strain DSM 15952 / CCUG 50447 / LMG 22039 / TP 1.5) TaxID=888064 RepID=E6LIZ4_ENTI1|nr:MULTISPECIES: hypothetical protein [Enterococcus]EFU72835.1 hypothetical protein HMPREF9088_2334 [Enterococcus italicus DSM 15952]MCM6930216.1 hypothetical protein [Enterococcus italicus]OJG56323.1 hypothetical protein RT43_GL001943 [Enterococcus italicus DSM 15952]